MTYTLANVAYVNESFEYSYTEYLNVTVTILVCQFKSVSIPFNNWSPYNYIVWNPYW